MACVYTNSGPGQVTAYVRAEARHHRAPAQCAAAVRREPRANL